MHIPLGQLPARLATRLPADRLRRGFAYLMFAVAAFVIVQSLGNSVVAGWPAAPPAEHEGNPHHPLTPQPRIT